MSAEIPTTMKALVKVDAGKSAVQDHPVPKYGPKDVLVKVVAVAQNPTDWKHVDFPVGKPGAVVGCDFSGTVVHTGADVTGIAVGDHVAGFVQGTHWPESGAFAEYVATPAELVWTVPSGTLSHAQAATLGCAYWTAVQALFHPTRLGLVEPPNKADGSEWILVYGGSSAVGQCAVQLAHLAGYKVVATASPRNFGLVKARGADVVVDYRASDAVAQIKAAAGDSIAKAVDCISERASQRFTAEALRPAGGKVVLVLAPAAGATTRKDVEFYSTLIYTSLGREFDLGRRFEVSLEDRAHMAAFLKKTPELVKSGAVTPLPVKLWPGGINGINDGLQYMREGKVSAEKLVYEI